VKILLLQDQVYLPSLGGGNKSNRLLLEDLASQGHECMAFCPALTTRAGPTNYTDLVIETAKRGVQVRLSADGCYSYTYRGVRVELTRLRAKRDIRDRARDTVHRFEPDWILVSDDKRRILLEAAIKSDPSRVVQVIQTVVHLPFGPLSHRISPRQASFMGQARKLVVISDFARQYIKDHGQLDSVISYLPVYGHGPYDNLGNFARGHLTMINPCVEKGVDIFLRIASKLPDLPFAAVPTWGTDDGVTRSLVSCPNMEIIPPEDDLDRILASTRVLLAPSVWFETFGYIVVESMLRGIPVVASDIGGLPESKLGVDYLIPVKPAIRSNNGFLCPPQDISPWLSALTQLLSDRDVYDHCSAQSRTAASKFLDKTRANSLIHLLLSLNAAED
jgi:glycosyltransferase involved in cell wall biosynthesis